MVQISLCWGVAPASLSTLSPFVRPLKSALIRRIAPEVVSADEDAGVPVRFPVQYELRLFCAIGLVADLKEGALAQPGSLKA